MSREKQIVLKKIFSDSSTLCRLPIRVPVIIPAINKSINVRVAEHRKLVWEGDYDDWQILSKPCQS